MKMRPFYFSLLSAFAILSPSVLAKSFLTLPNRETTLTNGLKVYTVAFPSPGVVAYQISVRVGSRNEVERGKTGFAHFFEHLMFRGTKSRTGAELGALYTRVGAENNAWTNNDFTSYHGVVATSSLEKILEAEGDRFQNLFFDEKQLKDEAGAVLGEYHKDVVKPGFVMEEKILATAFLVHPYGHTTMGYKADVMKFTERYADVWPFFRAHYRPENVSITLVGDVKQNAVTQMVEKYFGSWKKAEEKAPQVPQEPKQKEPREAEVLLEKPSQTRVNIGYLVPGFSTRTRNSAVLAYISELEFSSTSDFQKEFRFDKGWVDEAEAPAVETIDPSLWIVGMRLTQAGETHEKELRKAVIDRVESVATRQIPEKEIAKIRSRLKNRAVLEWFRSPDELAGRIGWYTGFEPDLGVLDRHLKRLDEVKAEDIQKYGKDYLVALGRTTVVLRGKK